MRILRNTENDRCFPFDGHLAKEPWMEIIELPGSKVPHVMSEPEKLDLQATRISKDTLPKDNLDNTHWTKLKQEVEKLGGKWSGKGNAIKFLRTYEDG